MSKTILDEELRGLSDEEREALEGDEALSADGDDEPDEDEDEEADESGAGETPEPARGGAGEDAASGAEAAGEDTTGPGEFQPTYVAPPVEGYAEKMAQIAQAQRELANGYENGDFDLAEYQAKLRQVTEHEWALREQQLKASLAAEQRQQQMAQRWQWEQERFFTNPANKAYREDPVIGPAFAAAVQLLAADANNDRRPMQWFLEEADRLTRGRFRVPGEGASSAANGQSGANREAQGRSGRAKSQVPPTLGGLPAASIPDVGGDEFSRLDRLEGMELEMALSRLNQAEADRYLNARAA